MVGLSLISISLKLMQNLHIVRLYDCKLEIIEKKQKIQQFDKEGKF